jgi:short-subunit dehydrogenase
MEAMSDALRIELTGTGVAVSIIEPGPISSAFRRTTLRLAEQNLDPGQSRFGPLIERELARRKANMNRTRRFTRPPTAVAKKILHAVTSPHPRRRYPITPHAHAVTWIRRLAPYALTDHILALPLQRALHADRESMEK